MRVIVNRFVMLCQCLSKEIAVCHLPQGNGGLAGGRRSFRIASVSTFAILGAIQGRFSCLS